MTCCTFQYTLFHLFLIIFWESRECDYEGGSQGDLMAMNNEESQLLCSHSWTSTQVSWIFNEYDVNTKIIKMLKKLTTWKHHLTWCHATWNTLYVHWQAPNHITSHLSSIDFPVIVNLLLYNFLFPLHRSVPFTLIAYEHHTPFKYSQQS